LYGIVPVSHTGNDTRGIGQNKFQVLIWFVINQMFSEILCYKRSVTFSIVRYCLVSLQASSIVSYFLSMYCLKNACYVSLMCTKRLAVTITSSFSDHVQNITTFFLFHNYKIFDTVTVYFDFFTFFDLVNQHFPLSRVTDNWQQC